MANGPASCIVIKTIRKTKFPFPGALLDDCVQFKALHKLLLFQCSLNASCALSLVFHHKSSPCPSSLSFHVALLSHPLTGTAERRTRAMYQRTRWNFKHSFQFFLLAFSHRILILLFITESEKYDILLEAVKE